MTESTTYAGNFVYKGTGSGLSLEYVLTPEGMIRNPASPEYHYFIKDLPNPFGMGNARVTITDADHDGVLDFNSNEILQTADYYPFGMMHYSQGGANKYLGFRKRALGEWDWTGTIAVPDFMIRAWQGSLTRIQRQINTFLPPGYSFFTPYRGVKTISGRLKTISRQPFGPSVRCKNYLLTPIKYSGTTFHPLLK